MIPESAAVVCIGRSVLKAVIARRSAGLQISANSVLAVWVSRLLIGRISGLLAGLAISQLTAQAVCIERIVAVDPLLRIAALIRRVGLSLRQD